jgi:hypothetical protein
MPSENVRGYVVWGTVGLAVAVPEMWALVAGDAAGFPTISGTVGYVEYWHPWAALVVVGVLVWAAFHALRYEAMRATREPREPALRRTRGGRLTLSDRIVELDALVYSVVAVAAIVGLSVWAYVDRPDDRYRLGEVLYGSIAFFGVVVPSLLAAAGCDVAFPTLFATVQALERRVRLVAALVAAGIAILLVHLAFYPWPDVIPDLQDLHAQHAGKSPRKQLEPPPDVP